MIRFYWNAIRHGLRDGYDGKLAGGSGMTWDHPVINELYARAGSVGEALGALRRGYTT